MTYPSIDSLDFIRHAVRAAREAGKTPRFLLLMGHKQVDQLNEAWKNDWPLHRGHYIPNELTPQDIDFCQLLGATLLTVDVPDLLQVKEAHGGEVRRTCPMCGQ